jgi:perosamine synthetase
VAMYNAALGGMPAITLPALRVAEDKTTTSWHLYAVELDFAMLGRTRTEVMAALRAAGVGTQVHYIPVHIQPWYRRTYGYGPGKCPVAERLYGRVLSLPLFPAMTDGDVAHVIAAVQALEPSRRAA